MVWHIVDSLTRDRAELFQDSVQADVVVSASYTSDRRDLALTARRIRAAHLLAEAAQPRYAFYQGLPLKRGTETRTNLPSTEECVVLLTHTE